MGDAELHLGAQVQPLVKTSGKRKGYKVFGLIDYFSGRFFHGATTGKLNRASYEQFLRQVLAQTTGHLVLLQDGARYHTSAALKKFFAQQVERLTVFQLPSYSPDFNPIEKLWKKIKEQDTHLHYFPDFTSLVEKVDAALIKFADRPAEILALFGLDANGLPKSARISAGRSANLTSAESTLATSDAKSGK